MLLVTLNSVILTPVLGFSYYAATNYRVRMDFEVENIPGVGKTFFTVIFCMICEDLTFHLTHRFLHWRVIYPYIHKIHHQYIVVCAIAAEHAHPIESLLGNVLPVFAGAIVLRQHCHAVAFFAWMFVRIS